MSTLLLHWEKIFLGYYVTGEHLAIWGYPGQIWVMELHNFPARSLGLCLAALLGIWSTLGLLPTYVRSGPKLQLQQLSSLTPKSSATCSNTRSQSNFESSDLITPELLPLKTTDSSRFDKQLELNLFIGPTSVFIEECDSFDE
ncbi:hypothetical protein DFH28DRAFT_1127624 [Melampsora americana]|nr:hypothetical protein DFH28DRAFT_1127624 [Melampsora americana]